MIFLFKSLEIQNSEKSASQKVVAMVTSNLIDKDLLHQIVPRYILGEVTKFGGFSLLIKKVINVQSPCGQKPPLPPSLPGLNRVKSVEFRRL